MNANVETMPGASSANTKPLWAAVGVLSVAVLAMGGGLIYVQSRPALNSAELMASAPVVATQSAAQAVSSAQSMADDEVVVNTPAKKPAVLAARPQPVKPKPLPAPAPAVVNTSPAPAPVVVAAAGTPQVIDHGVLVSQPVAKPVCANCGTIESVTAVQRKGEAKGVGAVAGGVLGAVVGNQVGNGNGRTAATILGALGGGLAGHTIEKNVKKETVYQVQVRMEDGSTRSIEQATLPAVGTRVVVEGNTVHSASGSAPAPSVANPQPQVQAVQVFNRS